MSMYYPYLRGKQFELLALRDYASKVKLNHIILPIIEPVRNSLKGISLASHVCQLEGLPLALILNPQVGDLCENPYFILNELSDSIESFRPTFILNRNVSYVRKIIAEYSLKDVILIRLSDATVTDEVVEELVSMDTVSTLVISDKFKRLRRKMKGQRKNVVMLNDCFTPLGKSTDYVGVEEDMFSEDYWYYGEEGYQGISDYTVLPSAFREGGSLPAAVVIHLTHAKDECVYVRHFVSDSNSGTGNIQGKFAEAAIKALSFFDGINYNTKALDMLRDYVSREEYPGLGMLKKISILHHLELVANILGAGL